MSKHVVATTAGRKRFSPLVIGAGIAAAIALSMSFSGTLSAYTASFLHPNNTVSTASIDVAETNEAGSSTTCTTDASGSATCSTPNLYSGQTLRPGDSKTTNVTFKNSGKAEPKQMTLTGGSCATTPSGNSVDLCQKVIVTMKWLDADVLPDATTPASLAGTSTTIPYPLQPSEVRTAKITVTLPANSANNTAGLSLSQPLTWTFTA
ncbi:hypothetical protein DEI99_013555 [Curtobacterium sp. MCLR17_036]|uniref:hypothetical protein n=1 Tax=Curtobacterium sp. MCLR17_036 TaxID=2175620 RepID=UPI000DA8A2A9|nr:hypothetical protein [Curtobacterium sp. MCLR17_036]WIE64250.1 hypothetical protein DEI99_013555 [Curtobacterium sp. MCLR17_036]